MATLYFAQANFKTAYLQKEISMDVTAASTLNLKVGDVVSITSAGVVSARSNATESTAKSSVALGDYIVAQSDMTMEYGHVPVENRDYQYHDDVVLGTAAKKAAFYRIDRLEDINITSRSVTTA